ncbi:cytochrome P450 [Mycolicibacterium pulveris]|uniref:cytochrome P450 n=1 Tax=Mycolicibacterium pulveris TaxID=36813 RepID=UPI003CF778F6
MTDTLDAAAPEIPIDLYSAKSFSNGHPFEQYRWLRANAPVYQHPAPDGGYFWAVTRNADIRHVEHHPELFQSAPSVGIVDAQIEVGFLSMDGARHAQFRKVLAPRLIPPRVKHMLPNLQRLASGIVDEVAGDGQCDVVELAGRMAGYTAAALLGIPREHGHRLHELFMITHSSPDVVGEEAFHSAFAEMAAMGFEALTAKKANPADDVLSAYAHMEVDGRPITDIEFLGNFILLADGSLDTSRNLISGGMKLLFDHPDVRRRLVDDLDALLPGAIEEMLRLLSPVVYIRRLATEDTELAGQPIAKGDRVVIYYGSGNRDERVYENPEEFDIDRKRGDHMAFGGGGPHFCVGSHLGRAEGTVMIRELLTRLPDIEQAGPETWAATSLTSGLASLPVRYTPSGT